VLLFRGMNKKLLHALHLYPGKTKRGLRQLGWYRSQRDEFGRLLDGAGLASDWPVESFPILTDVYAGGGVASGHYFHQDLLVAQRVYRRAPDRHVDFGSRVDGFVAHLASFREVTFVDLRSIQSSVENITFLVGDITDPDRDLIGPADSVSCLHVIEHVGLGRYGDTLDPRGHEKALDALTDETSTGGVLYVSTPIARQRIAFNAHRIFDPRFVPEHLSERFELEAFHYVDDAGDLHRDASLTDEYPTLQEMTYGCGIYELRKTVG
jgi:hypothetical protein